MDESLIEKFLFKLFSPLASNESKLWAELQGQFQIQLNESMQPYFDKVMEILDRLQQEHILIVDYLPGRMPSIRKGVLFDNWTAKMNSQENTPNSINIGYVNLQTAQIGNDNTLNIGIPVADFVEALKAISNKPDKDRKSIVDKIAMYANTGASLTNILTALVKFVNE